MEKRILLTGGTGYLGSHLAESLIANRFMVVVLKRKSSSLHRIESILPNLVLLDVDEIDLRAAFHDFGKIDAVINVAANYGRSGESISQILDANLNFPLRLMEAALAAGVRLFMNSDTALDKFLNAYSLSKGQFVEWGGYLARQKKIRFINLKLEHFYGGDDDDRKFTTQVIKSCLANAPELKLTLGEQRRDFVYVDDVVSAYLLLLEKEEELVESFVEFEVGSGEAVTIRQFVELVHRLTASTTYLDFGSCPYREGESMFSQADSAPLRQMGWRCRHTLEEGLRLAIEGYKQ